MRQVCGILTVFVFFLATASAYQHADVPALVKQLNDKDELVRLRAAKQLGKAKDLPKYAVAALKRIAEQDADEDVRTVAKRALESIAGRNEETKRKEVVEPLVKALRSRKPDERLKAVIQLADLGEDAKDAASVLVELLTVERVPAIQTAGRDALRHVDQAIAKDVVMVLDGGGSNPVKNLEKLGSKAINAMPALKFYYAKEATQFARGAGAPYSQNVAPDCLSALANIAPDDRTVIDAVLLAVAMPVGVSSPVRRDFALDLLSVVNADKRKETRALVAALSDEKCQLRVIKRLGKLGPDAKDALPALNKLKLEPLKEVRDAVAAAIEAISK